MIKQQCTNHVTLVLDSTLRAHVLTPIKSTEY